MSALESVLQAGGFGITGELAPPKGSDFTKEMEAAASLRGRVHGVNVTDQQSACLKASTIGFCIALKQAGFDPILQLTGRDRNRIALLADVLSAAAFGIDTVLAITGDHPKVGDCAAAKPVYDLDSVGILRMLSKMEKEGVDCGGNQLESPAPHLFKGAVVTPAYEPLALQLAKLKKKADAGAQYIQTQGVFDMETLQRLRDGMEKMGLDLPVLAGIIPLKSAGMARYMIGNVPGIQIPDALLERLDAAAAETKATGKKGLAADAGRSIAAELIKEIKESGVCAGVHIMSIGAPQAIPVILDRAGIQ